MAKRLIIAIDCDDVLIETTEYIVDVYNQQYDTLVALDKSHDQNNEQWRVPDGTLLIQRFNEIQSTEAYARLVPMPEALRVVKQLARDHELHLVTARDGSIEAITEAMLDEYLPGCFTSMEHVGRDRSKGEVCQQLKADILIDDSIRNLLSALEYGLPAGGALHFGEYAWNRVEPLPEGVVTCFDWEAVEREVERIAA